MLLDVGTAIALAAAVAAVVWLMQGPQVIHPEGWDQLLAAEQSTATGQWRLMIVQATAALGAAVALAYTARNYRLSHRGQVTDRFTKALERLGSDELYVRIGGVHALGQVLHDAPDQHQHILDVLCAFIRERAGVSDQRLATTPVGSWIHPPTGSDPPAATEVAEDVQAALTVLGRRPVRPEDSLELGHLQLRGARLNGADLTGASLDHADLTGAVLAGADLTRAWLDDADLTDAVLAGADLTDALLERADLTDARLDHADLTGALLNGADLTRAWLNGADLTRAYLTGALIHRQDAKHLPTGMGAGPSPRLGSDGIAVVIRVDSGGEEAS